jgi:tetratricopeptide (TPR) repeat protein
MRKSPFILIAAVSLVFSVNQPLSYAQQENLKRAEQLTKQVGQLYRQGKYAEAVSLAEESLAIREKALGPDHPNVATSLNGLASLYKSLGDYAKAERLYQSAQGII